MWVKTCRHNFFFNGRIIVHNV
ncbi:hypothetical protein ACFOSP_00955 [Clostridium punense]